MKYYLVILLFLLIFKTEAQVLEQAKKIIDTLCSTNMHGRGYVNNGVNIAANYLSNTFKEMGLQVEEQPFTFMVNSFSNNMLVQIGNDVLIPGQDFIITPYSHSIKGNFEIIYCDKETFLNKKAFTKFIENTPEAYFMCINTDLFDTKEKKELVKRISQYRGLANGYVLLTKNKLTWGSSEYITNTPILIVNANTIQQVSTSLTVDIDAEQITEYPNKNIIASTKKKKTQDSIIVITAHYDHLGRMGKNTYFPGANDNASGIAMQLALAKKFAQTNNKYQYVFIAFAGEEQGLLGSKHFVDNATIDLNKIKFVFNIDLCGTGNEGIMLVNAISWKDEKMITNKLTVSIKSKIENINITKNYVKAIQLRANASNSDHYWFTQKNVPALFMYTLGGSKAYHDIYDTADNLSLAAFENIFLLLEEAFSY